MNPRLALWLATAAEGIGTSALKAGDGFTRAGPARVVLVIHGALDYRVPDAQGLAYYNTLKAKGVDARLLWYPDENHWILKPANNVIWYHEFFDWIKRYDPAFKKKK